MAGLDADTSSYNQPLPVGPLEQAGKIGALQQQSLQINQAKMDQANQALGYMTRAMGSLGPNASKEEYAAVAQNAVKQGLVPQEQLNSYMERLQAAKSAPDFYNEFMTAAVGHQEAINYHLGQRQDISTGQTVTPAVSSVKPGFGVRPISAPIQQQLPVGTEGVDTQRTLPDGRPNPNYGAKSLIGPQPAQIPSGTLPVQGGIPGQYRNAPLPPTQPGPVTNPAIMGQSSNFGGKVVGATAEAPTFADRFSAARPGGVTTSLPPGTGGAMETGAQGGAVAAVNARQRAGSFQREIFPLLQAIPALERLGPKGTGPGQETINHIKSFALTNVPGVKESDFNGTVADYDKAKKYLTDFVNQTGNSGTNDKLAAAFAGNPSVGFSNAAAIDVAKSALSLRRMQQAEIVAFEKSGLPDSEFQRFSVRFNNEQDPRAYGVDMIPKEKLKKLVEGMSPEELRVFKSSIQIAHETKSIQALKNGR